MTDSFFKEDRTEKKDNAEIPNLTQSDSEDSDQSEQFTTSTLSEEGKMAAILSYIPLLCFIPLMNMKDNKVAQFHARQGVLLFLIELAAVLFLIDGVSNFVFKAILIAAVALSVVGIYFALQGKNYKIPFIGDMADKTKL